MASAALWAMLRVGALEYPSLQWSGTHSSAPAILSQVMRPLDHLQRLHCGIQMLLTLMAAVV